MLNDHTHWQEGLRDDGKVYKEQKDNGNFFPI